MSEQDREALIAWALKGYRNRRDYDDILQMGRIGAWQSLQSRPNLNPKTSIVHGARWAANRYIRQRWVKAEEPMDHQSPQWPRQQSSDFAPRLIERLAWRLELKQALAVMRTQEREALLRVTILQQSLAEIGMEMGKSVDQVYRLKEHGIKRARRAAQKGKSDGMH